MMAKVPYTYGDILNKLIYSLILLTHYMNGVVPGTYPLTKKSLQFFANFETTYIIKDTRTKI